MAEIYVPLLNEGTEVLRPTKGILLGPDDAQLLPTDDYDPDVEEWEFPPGTRVKCAWEMRSGQRIMVARKRQSAD